MNVRTSGIRRLSLALCLCVFAMSASPAKTVAPARESTVSLDSLTRVQYQHEARLRKLHLVRPDLISYPISFDAVC